MVTVLAVSSFVAHGAVGLRAILPALDRLGVRAIACPTTILSNHLGHRHWDGAPVAPATLAAMADALDANGWLGAVDAVLTGYAPSPAHVSAMEGIVERVRARRPDALVVCDPVLGDDPGGLYVPETVAAAVRETLVPRATHLKANRFELAYLTGRPVETEVDAVRAARALGCRVVLVTSVPGVGDRLANVIVTPTHAGACTVPRESGVPRGTGDLLAAVFAARALDRGDSIQLAAASVAAVAELIARSRGADALHVADPAPWHAAPPLAVTPIVVD